MDDGFRENISCNANIDHITFLFYLLFFLHSEKGVRVSECFRAARMLSYPQRALPISRQRPFFLRHPNISQTEIVMHCLY